MTDLNSIATEAARLKPINRNDAEKFLLYLIEKSDADAADWAPVYKWLISGKLPAKPKNAFAWVSKALANKKDPRCYLRHVFADGARIVGTDGHRLHAVADDRPAGFYDAKGVQIEVEARFPDIDRVIPADDLPEHKAIVRNLERVHVKAKLTAVRLPCGRAVNEVYLFDAMAGDTAGLVYQASADINTPIRVRNRYGFAVIMPMRL